MKGFITGLKASLKKKRGKIKTAKKAISIDGFKNEYVNDKTIKRSKLPSVETAKAIKYEAKTMRKKKIN